MGKTQASAGGQKSSLTARRPAWSGVYDGYPKVNGGTSSESDEDPEIVFTGVFGADYDKSTYFNACGTRVSLALLAGGMRQVGNRGVKITNKSNKFYGKQIEPGAGKLKDILENKWGGADIVINFPTDISDVRKKLSGKKGVYIMIPKSPRVFNASGHATLWTGYNVINAQHHYVSEYTAAIYFWELK
ncbi:TPA: hypothetical protein N3A33_005248 [Salmonella enterica subsp. salamae serovar 28:r:e,n,z15]|nr:hypothetical protein [Salmonella enterica subsp. salamae serovar 28:r:e,n,z15]